MIRAGGHDGLHEWLRRDQVVRAMATDLARDLEPATAIALLASDDGRPRRDFARRCDARYVARGGTLRPLPSGAVARAVLAELPAAAAVIVVGHTQPTGDVRADLDLEYPEGDAVVEHTETCDRRSAGDECIGGCAIHLVNELVLA